MRNGGRNKQIVLIAGPTASGKSAVAMELAGLRPAVIINADALQVYRELRILSARPSPEDERRVPHRLYGMVPAAQPYSVALWLDAARHAIEESWAKERVPLVTGGTGLYFRALECGLAQLPPIPADVRQHWRNRLKREGSPALHAELAKREKSEAERLRPSDGHRIARALEVLEATGKPLPAWQEESRARGFLAASRVLRLYLCPAREDLYGRINARFDHMIEAGAVKEVAALLALKLEPSLPAMKATGVAELAEALRGTMSLEEACRIAKRNTRHYAKRQLTWARSNMISWNRLSEKLKEQSVQHFFNFIRVTG